MDQPKALASEHRVDIAAGIILSIVTCGLYNIYWNYLQFEAMNALLGRREYRFWPWLLLSIVSCGIYHIYYEYKMGSDLQVWLAAQGRPVQNNLAIIGLVFSCVGLTIIADAVYQHELNKLA